MTLATSAAPTLPATSATPTDTGQQWVADSIAAQLARHPGGVASGNTIRYAKDDVTLTYKPATAPGAVAAAEFGCSTGEICLYSTSNVDAAGCD
ncbi:hypothetical protein ACFQ9X_47090 [Catenulispora yoronensis]